MKRRIVIFLLCLLLCGCTAAPSAVQDETRTSETRTERITTQPVKAPSETTQEQESQQAIMTQVPTEAQTSTSPPVPTQLPSSTEKPESTRPPATLPPAAEPTEPAPTEPAPTEPVPSTEPTEAETPTEPPTEPPAEPPFDSAAWVNFAREYAASLGLVLNSAATSCWDNPILASAQSRYLERDLKGVLEDYASAPDITQVWIWSELRPDGRYDIYIGYA